MGKKAMNQEIERLKVTAGLRVSMWNRNKGEKMIRSSYTFGRESGTGKRHRRLDIAVAICRCCETAAANKEYATCS